MSRYLCAAVYHQEDRIHDSLEKDTPHSRAVEQKPAAAATVISMPRLVHCIIATRGAKRDSSRQFSLIAVAGIADDGQRAACLSQRRRADSGADIWPNRFAVCRRNSWLPSAHTAHERTSTAELPLRNLAPGYGSGSVYGQPTCSVLACCPVSGSIPEMAEEGKS
jgi:hypothetical protein